MKTRRTEQSPRAQASSSVSPDFRTPGPAERWCLCARRGGGHPDCPEQLPEPVAWVGMRLGRASGAQTGLRSQDEAPQREGGRAGSPRGTPEAPIWAGLTATATSRDLGGVGVSRALLSPSGDWAVAMPTCPSCPAWVLDGLRRSGERTSLRAGVLTC